MASQIVKTADGREATVTGWTCPECGHVQDDTVHPELGPFISVTCGACIRTFSDDQLSAEDLQKWDEARDLAETMAKPERN